MSEQLRTPLRIAVAGCNGRMGKCLIQSITANENTVLAAASECPGSSVIGADAGEIAGVGRNGVVITDDFAKVADDFDLMIDFTRPEPSIKNIELCVKNKKSLVLGTTGFSNEQLAVIDEAAKKIAIVFASNFSVGVNLVFNLLEQATKVMGAYSDIEIIEAHHRHKVDAPSGTALSMGKVIAAALDKNLDEIAVKSRDGIIGERKPGTIGFSTIRAADIVGEHTVMFADIGERVEITHKASSRMTFANGAVRAAIWVDGMDAGLYSMKNVLDL